MKIVGKILHLIDLLNEWLGKVFGFLIVALMFLVVVDTCLRYFFNSPTIWGLDVSEMFLLGIVCLGGGYCLLHGGHVKVDILYVRFSPRKRAFIDLVTHLFLLILCLVIIKFGVETAWNSYSLGEVSVESGWEYVMWPLLSLVPLSGLLLGLQALAKWIRDLTIVIKGSDALGSKVVRGEGGLRG